MGKLTKSSIGLRVFGDEVIPEQITSLLGHEPTGSGIKGHPRYPSISPNKPRLARTGSWVLSCKDRSPGDLDGQVKEILDLLTNDFKIWKKLSEQYELDMFCGLWLTTYNEGISLSLETLKALSDRHIFIDFDIYHDDGEEE